MGTENSQNEAPRGRVGRKSKDNNKTNNSTNVKYAYNQLNCMYTNADSLMNKFIEFKERVKMNNCLVIGITEVKPKNQRFIINLAELALENYDMFQINVTEATGRGVILYTHKSLKAISITMNTQFQESVWAEIPLNSKDAMLVGVIYRSPGSSEVNNDKLNQTIIEAVGLNHSHFLLMGDFNYPNIKWDSESTESNTVEDKFIENIRDNFLFQHITKPTRGRLGNKSNILDLIFTNEEGMIEDVTYESPLGKSDHAVLLINHRCYTETTTYTKLKFYYNQGDYSGMSNKLEQCDWEEILGSGSVNSQWLNLKEYIKVTENEFIPHSIVSGNSNKHKGKIPVSRDTITKIKKKHIAWKRYMETKNEEHYAEYCRVRNQVRTLSRKLQKQYELKLAIDAKSNPQAVWKYMNSKTKTRECVSDLNINPHDDK